MPDPRPHVVGGDISLTASGLAWPDHYTTAHGVSGLTSVGTPLAERAQRLRVLAQMLCVLSCGRHVEFDDRPPALVVLEGLPTSGTKVDSERCYLWWRLVELLTECGTPILVVPPSTVKLYMTGLGNANKREVIAAVRTEMPGWEIRKTSKAGKVLTTDDDNKADAVVLMAIGCHLLGRPLLPETPFRARALEKLILPPGAHR